MKLQKETKLHGRWYNDACGTAFGLELAGERWSLLVIRELMFGGLRFSDLRASLPGISAKVLTERLESLEASGAVRRRKLEPPVSAQVYELTEWGLAAEPLIQELGRWAAQNPMHDPTLPLSPTSFMLSLRTMFDRRKASGRKARVGFLIGSASFVGQLSDGVFTVTRTAPLDCDFTFAAEIAPQLAGLFYGKAPASEVGVTIEGDAKAAQQFIDIFELPPPLSLA